MSETIGIIGLGRMGMPAAKKYIKEGYEVVGYARRPEVIEEFTSFGGTALENSKEVAEKAGKVIVYVLNDQQVIEVVTGPDGILEGCHEDTRVICMATIDKENLEWVAGECAKKQVGLVDCPVTGGPARVEAGTLTLIVAAPKDLLEECRAILEVQGQITYVAETPGMGQAVKHCNQLLVATTLAATAEVITLARKSGLDTRLVCQVIGNGICGSDYFRLVASAILDDTPSPGGLGQMCKDIGLVINDSRRVQAPLVVASAASQYFLSALSLGMENADSSELIRVLEKMTNPDG
ncbi:MAG: NAD(P)-dependent oxidoreductase [Desulfobacterales bacterium]|nr:MAG: NAD(P)-dependent oxidoreductase [Desulfobacterales bacterium]